MYTADPWFVLKDKQVTEEMKYLMKSPISPLRKEWGTILRETYLNFVANPFLPSSLQYQYVTLNYFMRQEACFSFFLQTSGFLILKYDLLGGK